MSNSLPGKWRYNIIFGVLMLLCIALVGQSALLVHDGEKDSRKLVRKQERITDELPGRTGSILFKAKGRPVLAAVSKEVPSCYADPKMLDNDKLAEVASLLGEALHMKSSTIQEIIVSKRDNTWKWLKKGITQAQLEAIADLNLPGDFGQDQLPEISRKLAPILKMDRAVLADKLANRWQQQFCWIKHDITEGEREAVNKLVRKKRLRGIGVKWELRRTYPNNELAASVVGFLQWNGAPGEGIESLMHYQTAGNYGVMVSAGDVARRRVAGVPEETVLPKDGNHVFLTIDVVIQQALEKSVADAVEKFKGKWGVGIVMDPRTGEILAMCSAPTYNPNEFNKVAPELRKNHCLADPYEPGSAFKTIVAAAAVDLNIGITWDTKFFCENGVYHAPRGGTITDHGNTYGTLSLLQGNCVSSNICFSKLGEKLGNERLYEIVHRFGFGERTNMQMPDGKTWAGETGGIVREPLKYWDGYSLRRVPFGQEVSVSALQLANAYCAIANGGELLQPRLVERVVDSSGRKTLWQGERKVVRRVLSPEGSRKAIHAMTEVVENPKGTGRISRMDRHTSGGKTGTAQIAMNGIYVPKAFTASFVACAPASDPRLVCLVSVYWPRTPQHYGSQVAAPAVKEVLEKSLAYLEVPADRAEDDVPRADVGEGSHD